jgi:hypothetical protein
MRISCAAWKKGEKQHKNKRKKAATADQKCRKKKERRKISNGPGHPKQSELGKRKAK